MKNTTLVYIEKDGCYLMLLRNKKLIDENKGKWIGVGGKFEEGESPEECMLREVYEETGLTLTRYQYRAVVTFVSDEWGTEYMHLFTADSFTGEPKECDEGMLKWIPKDEIMDLNLWDGDREFLPLLFEDSPFFTMRLQYRGDDLTEVKKDFYENDSVSDLYEEITKTLISQNRTISTMESITSGTIASLITDTEGSSAILKGAFVTYSNEAKVMQGVPSEVILKYGVYSKETALAMAKSCAKCYGADIGIGVTGTAGNIDPGNTADSVLGEVHFAIAAGEKERSYTINLAPQNKRSSLKHVIAKYVGESLREFLME